MAITVATWNVNSIRARLGGVLAWLAEEKPDIVCLQEIKTTHQDFPQTEFSALNYNLAIFGQRLLMGWRFYRAIR